jgi:hypothetical protein
MVAVLTAGLRFAVPPMALGRSPAHRETSDESEDVAVAAARPVGLPAITSFRCGRVLYDLYRHPSGTGAWSSVAHPHGIHISVDIDRLTPSCSQKTAVDCCRGRCAITVESASAAAGTVAVLPNRTPERSLS